MFAADGFLRMGASLIFLHKQNKAGAAGMTIYYSGNIMTSTRNQIAGSRVKISLCRLGPWRSWLAAFAHHVGSALALHDVPSLGI